MKKYLNQKGSVAKMTDIEYAVTIYCAALKEESDLGDAYLQGVLNTLATLPEKHANCLAASFSRGQKLQSGWAAYGRQRCVQPANGFKSLT